MPKFSILAFHERLQPYRVPDKVEQIRKDQNELGISRVIQYVWNHYPTNQVNFDSFTLENLKDAMDFMSFAPIIEDEDADYVEEVQNSESDSNIWAIYNEISNIIYYLTRIKGRIYETDDDFI